jgi:hypothetical protein
LVPAEDAVDEVGVVGVGLGIPPGHEVTTFDQLCGVEIRVAEHRHLE